MTHTKFAVVGNGPHRTDENGSQRQKEEAGISDDNPLSRSCIPTCEVGPVHLFRPIDSRILHFRIHVGSIPRGGTDCPFSAHCL